MSERYCPECKQNVQVNDDCPVCFDCRYEFDLSVDKTELEELVAAIEAFSLAMNQSAYGIGWLTEINRAQNHADKTAAKFRAKYLEGK